MFSPQGGLIMDKKIALDDGWNGHSIEELERLAFNMIQDNFRLVHQK